MKCGGQNTLLKFCGGHGPPGPPGSDAYGPAILLVAIIYTLITDTHTVATVQQNYALLSCFSGCQYTKQQNKKIK